MTPLKDQVKRLMGECLLQIRPEYGRQLAQQGITLDIGQHLGLQDRLIRYALLARAAAEPEPEKLLAYHRDYWTNRGKEYFDFSREVGLFERYFLPNLGYALEALAEHLAHRPFYTTLVEIGCGSGELLTYVATQFPQLTTCIGIDLSADQIAENQQRYQEKRLTFVAADGYAWVLQHGRPNTIYLTSRGVLEYFSQAQLEEMFTHLAQKEAPALFMCIEPIGMKHDLNTQTVSLVYGKEFSLSHNYPYLFEQAGFEIWHRSQIAGGEDHVLTIIGAERR